MKEFIVLAALTTLTLAVLFLNSLGDFSREKYLNEKVLEMSVPIDVKIDTEFLKNLEPANE
ncbi:hypothetical protein C4561_03930 [candidate division WWE3 bacterium]|jgi:UDP-glucose 6-dehydrogenase|uniref:Uncharacterized protein n=1 Tax=candidate division WWE3 bacterium TaxID=2053526 RepID=A0A3A4ZCS9_UNCKA|nr:MAG: hypothetical protein C4561_03930 [candidate division WWE3 bacterium]